MSRVCEWCPAVFCRRTGGGNDLVQRYLWEVER